MALVGAEVGAGVDTTDLAACILSSWMCAFAA